jgi:hypothetical protein
MDTIMLCIQHCPAWLVTKDGHGAILSGHAQSDHVGHHHALHHAYPGGDDGCGRQHPSYTIPDYTGVSHMTPHIREGGSEVPPVPPLGLGIVAA